MTVRAKFKCESVKQEGETASITLRAVYDSDPNSENGQFFKYTPSGQIILGVVNPAAAKQFEEGKEYYVDFVRKE
jgi:hypothetical protein